MNENPFTENFEKNNVVGKTVINDVRISTVLLLFSSDGYPYETLVIGGALDGECQRYSTVEEARAGHEAMIQRVKEAEADAKRD